MQAEITKAVNDAFNTFLFDWDYRTYLLVGGYGSSKSYHIALKIILKLFAEKRKCLVVRDTYESIKESCYDLMYEILDEWDMVRGENTREYKGRYVIAKKSPLEFNFPNGSKIIFKGMDKTSKVKSINGLSIVWLEECSEITYAAYKELNLRLRTANSSIHYILSTNPVEKANWVYKHFFVQDLEDGKKKVILDDNILYEKKIVVKNGVYYHHSTVDDNVFLNPDYIVQLNELEKYDPDLYRIARKGRFGVNGKKVLPQFEVATNAKEFKQCVRQCTLLRNGMDFGFEESFNAAIKCAVDLKESALYIYDEYYRNKMTDDKTAKKLIEWDPQIQDILIKADSAEPKTIQYYQQSGFQMRGTWKISRLEQVKKIKRFKKIVCSPKCKNTIRELQDLVYKEDKNGNKIYDEFNIDPHTFSAIWYALDDITVADVKYKSNSKAG